MKRMGAEAFAVGGIFVGGGSTRMGGRPKGLLPSPEGPTLVERWRSLLRDVGADVVLVGGDAALYKHLGLSQLRDDPPDIGPLGGMRSLLRYAEDAVVLAVACDMPFVSPGLLSRLLNESPGAPVLAPRRAGKWEPLCARYDASIVLPIVLSAVALEEHSLQPVLDEAEAVELALSPGEARQLADWDSPSDIDASA